MILFESFIQVKQSLEHDIFIKTNSLVIDRYLRYQARPKNLNTKIVRKNYTFLHFFGADETIPVNLVERIDAAVESEWTLVFILV